MSRLEFYSRPLIAFDPCKKEHRAIYHKFSTRASWGHSPFRFICPEDHGHDLPSMINKLMLEYYMDKEFGKPVAVETSRKEVQKIRRLVDKDSKR